MIAKQGRTEGTVGVRFTAPEYFVGLARRVFPTFSSAEILPHVSTQLFHFDGLFGKPYEVRIEINPSSSDMPAAETVTGPREIYVEVRTERQSHALKIMSKLTNALKAREIEYTFGGTFIGR